MKFLKLQSLILVCMLVSVSNSLFAELFRNKSEGRIRVLIFKGYKGDLVEKFFLPRNGKKAIDLGANDFTGIFVVARVVRAGEITTEDEEMEMAREVLAQEEAVKGGSICDIERAAACGKDNDGDSCDKVCGASFRVAAKDMYRNNEFTVTKVDDQCKLKIKLIRLLADDQV